MSAPLSPRGQALQAVCDAAKRLGKYFVRRGDYDLAVHDWSKRGHVAYVMAMQNGFDFNREHQPFVAAEVQLVLARGTPENASNAAALTELDESVLDELAADATWILQEASRAVQEESGDWKTEIFTTTATMREFHNAGHSIQGIGVTFQMQY